MLMFMYKHSYFYSLASDLASSARLHPHFVSFVNDISGADPFHLVYNCCLLARCPHELFHPKIAKFDVCEVLLARKNGDGSRRTDKLFDAVWRFWDASDTIMIDFPCLVGRAGLKDTLDVISQYADKIDVDAISSGVMGYVRSLRKKIQITEATELVCSILKCFGAGAQMKFTFDKSVSKDTVIFFLAIKHSEQLRHNN